MVLKIKYLKTNHQIHKEIFENTNMRSYTKSYKHRKTDSLDILITLKEYIQADVDQQGLRDDSMVIDYLLSQSRIIFETKCFKIVLMLLVLVHKISALLPPKSPKLPIFIIMSVLRFCIFSGNNIKR